jgi:hypothetical protein
MKNEFYFAVVPLLGMWLKHRRISVKDNTKYHYKIQRLTGTLNIDANWEKSQWARIPSLVIANYMGEKPGFLPITEAKVQYDDENIYVIFQVQDRYVRAVETEIHGKVWEDACVEFFFAPERSEPLHYFNVEVNCGGTALISFNRVPGVDYTTLALRDMQQIEIAHTLPKIVNPEIAEPVVWTLEYRLPPDVLEKYTGFTHPKPGVIWRGNFQKCAETNSHPHWLTWARIEHPIPKFHMPQFFGKLEFTE